jgi:LAO/AO transport system kinase
VSELVDRVFSGDVRAAARLCRLIDDRAAGHRELLTALYARPAHAAPPEPAATRAYVIGVTGSPGAGKSTLVDRLVSAFRAGGGKVGVVAVDPTSPFSGGAILGDRIRMQRHFEDPEVFIRSVATRGALGGLSRSARDVVRVLEAWGARVVLLETVGVGQDELDVTRVADSTAVVLAPGQGDDVQAIKAGILECADVFVVNKADRPGADATVRDLENMLAIGALSLSALSSPAQRGPSHHAAARPVATPGAASGIAWVPPIVKTVATGDQGIAELVAKLAEHRVWVHGATGEARRTDKARRLLEDWLRDEIADAVGRECGAAVAAAATAVLDGTLDPHSAVERLVADFRAPR